MTTRQRRRKPAAAVAVAPSLGTFPPPTETSEQMAVDNRMLAMDIANRFARANGMQVADLETPAWVGLLKACRLFDPEKINPHTGKPYALSSFAVPYIRGAMKQHVRDRTYAIKFPHRWREIGPKVRRLHSSGMTPTQVHEAIQPAPGVTVEEVTEIIESMRGTVELDLDHHGEAAVDELAIKEEDDRAAVLFQQAMTLGEAALGEVCRADRDTIRAYWLNSRRFPYPAGPLQQFRMKVRELVGASNAPGGTERMLMPLGFDVVAVAGMPPRLRRRANPHSRRSAAELTADAEQLGLFELVFEMDEGDGEP